MSFFQSTPQGYLIQLHIVPGADRTQVAGRHGDRLKIRVAAPPEKGTANKALLTFLSRCLQVPKSQVRLKSGARDRAKVVEVLDANPELATRLEALAREE